MCFCLCRDCQRDWRAKWDATTNATANATTIMARLNWLTSEAWGITTLANRSCRRTLRSICHPKYSHLASGVPVRPNISWRVLWVPLVLVHTRTIPRFIRTSSTHGLPQLFADISFLRWQIPIILPTVHGVYLLNMGKNKSSKGDGMTGDQIPSLLWEIDQYQSTRASARLTLLEDCARSL
jgi:hypothetical protein